MKNQSKLLTVLGLSLLIMTACKPPREADFTGVPETYIPPERPVFPSAPASDEKPIPKGKQAYIQSANLQGPGKKKMDILFVIDDSESMCGDQRTLSANISKFVDVFVRNKKIDFQIGVVSSWDSRLFGNATRAFKNGELRPVHGQPKDVRFITNNTPNLTETLKRTINIGYLKYNKNSPATSGSENEEFFSPIMAAFGEEMSGGPNKGFSRPDADKGIIIITDAEDGTPDVTRPGQTVQASDVSLALDRLVTEGNNVTVLGAFARLDEMVSFQLGKQPGLSKFSQKFKNGTISNCSSYSIDPGIVDAYKGPAQLNELVRLKKGTSFDLQSKDFGARMADMGKKLVTNSLNYRISLDKALDVSAPIKVALNGKAMSRNEWSYDAEANQIVLNESSALSNIDNFQVDIEYYILD